MLALILLYENFFLLHDTGKVDRDSDLEQCNANNCVIEDAPSNMKVVKWLNCDACHMWFHGFCIKAKACDYRKKTWLCDKCKKN